MNDEHRTTLHRMREVFENPLTPPLEGVSTNAARLALAAIDAEFARLDEAFVEQGKELTQLGEELARLEKGYTFLVSELQADGPIALALMKARGQLEYFREAVAECVGYTLTGRADDDDAQLIDRLAAMRRPLL